MDRSEIEHLELVSLKPSPYSERTRWALRALNLPFTITPYQGEYALRWRLGRYDLRQRVTVPVAFVTTTTKKAIRLEDGMDIAKWADSLTDDSAGESKNTTKLFPEGLAEEVEVSCEKSSYLLDFGRAEFMRATEADPSLVEPMLPALLRRLGPITRLLCSMIVGSMKSKYLDLMNGVPERAREILSQAQERIEEEQAKKQTTTTGSGTTSPPPVFLVGDSLTLADIYMTVAINLYSRLPSRKPHEFFERFSPMAVDKEFPKLHAWAESIWSQYNCLPGDLTNE